jgi:hypothetical protein
MAYFGKVELAIRRNVFDAQKDRPIIGFLGCGVWAIVYPETEVPNRT